MENLPWLMITETNLLTKQIEIRLVETRLIEIRLTAEGSLKESRLTEGSNSSLIGIKMTEGRLKEINVHPEPRTSLKF